MLMRMEYVWCKILKKIRGKSVIQSCISKQAKIGSGSNVINVKMDRNSYCGYDCTLVNCNIGAFCSIADNVSIGLASHPVGWVSMSPVFLNERSILKKKYATHFYESSCETHIGNDVWIGKGAYLKAGITVGNGAVIGMGSVVTKDVPDYAVVGGIPARVMYMRFSKEEVKQLIQTEWWNWEEDKLKEYAIHFNNIDKFLEKVEKR